MEVICPGTPTHIIQVEDPHLLYHMLKETEANLVVLSSIEPTPEWRQEMEEMDKEEPSYSYDPETTTINLASYAIAQRSHSDLDLARKAKEACKSNPSQVVKVFKLCELNIISSV